MNFSLKKEQERFCPNKSTLDKKRYRKSYSIKEPKNFSLKIRTYKNMSKNWELKKEPEIPLSDKKKSKKVLV